MAYDQKKSEYNRKSYLKSRKARLEYAKRYREQNKELIAEKAKIYRENNKESTVTSRKRYYEQNKELIAEKAKIYRENNKELIAAGKKRYYEQNKELIAEKAKIYRENNKEHYKEYRKLYREDQISKDPSFYRTEYIKHRSRINSDKTKLAAYKYTTQKASAKSRNIEWALDREYVIKILLESKHCAISGVKLSFKVGDKHIPSIDRIDSSKGYTPKNIQIVSSIVNKMKQELSQREFKLLCKKISGVA